MLLLLIASSCGKKTALSATPASGGRSGPSISELQDQLRAEFDRLGIDPNKVTAQAPTGAANAVFDLQATVIDPDGPEGEPPTGVQLTWTERLIGDYDQNGQANISDVSPIGAFWNESIEYDAPGLHAGIAYWPAGDPAADGALNWRKARVDGDGNGLITIAELTPLASHFLETLSGYQIERAVNYGQGSVTWEPVPLDIGEGTLPTVPRNLATKEVSGPVRYSVFVPLASPELAHYYRVRPYDALSETNGAASNVVDYTQSSDDTAPPYWIDKVGVTKLVPSDGQLEVRFGNAVDDASPPVSYRVFWLAAMPEDQSPFDYSSAQHADCEGSPFIIEGLLNGDFYRVAVRAFDSALTPNIETNLVDTGATVGPTDIYPPEWQGAPGVQDLVYGSGKAYISWNKAVDNHNDGSQVWQSDPVVYRIYHGLGLNANWTAAEVVETEGSSGPYTWFEIADIDTTKPHWFAVRTRDSSLLLNEDANTVTVTSYGFEEETVTLDPPPGLPDGVAKGGWLLVSPDRTRLALYLRWNGTDEKTTAFYDYVNSEWVLRSTIEASPLAAYLHNDGTVSVISTYNNSFYENDLRVYPSIATAPTDYDLDMGRIDRAGFAIDGTVWVFSTKVLEALPNTHLQQFFSVQPFTEQTLLTEWTLDDQQPLIENDVFDSAPAGDTLRILALARGGGERRAIQIDYSNGSVAQVDLPLTDEEGYSPDSLFGWGTTPISVFIRGSDSDLHYLAKAVQGTEELSFGFGLFDTVGIASPQHIAVAKNSLQLEHFGLRIYAHSYGWVGRPEESQSVGFLELQHQEVKLRMITEVDAIHLSTYFPQGQYFGIGLNSNRVRRVKLVSQ